MVKFSPIFKAVFGIDNQSTIYIKDGSGDWQDISSYESFRIYKKQNQVSEFEVVIQDIEATEKAYVKEFAEIMFFSGTTLILKGRIQKATYSTSYSCIITGYGMEAVLLDKDFIKSDDKRVQYTSESAQTVAKELLSTNSDGSSPWVMEPITTGIFDTDYGDLSLRFEYVNRLNALGKLSEIMNYEWGVTHSGDYETDYFNLAPYLPSETRATVSQETFAITGASANCEQSSNEKDVTNLMNRVDVLGYGDGINQISTSTYNASETFNSLGADATDSATTITLTDASSFDSSGEVRIMEERITYSGKSGNNLTGCTRGANSTTAREHKKGCFVEKYIAITSAESGSSIGTNGLLDFTVTNRNLLDLPTAELIASNKLSGGLDPIQRIILIPNEAFETSQNRELGDLITIVDAESDLNDDFRIVGMTFVSYYGDLTLELECSNRTLTFIEQMQKDKEANENLSKYMQGSTNIYALSEADNCDTDLYLNMKFFVPNETIAINKVLLSFKMSAFRSDNTDWSIHGSAFQPLNQVDGSMDDVYYYELGIEAASGSFKGTASVSLPDGVTVTSVIIYGGDSNDTWTLKRALHSTGVESNMASGTFDTADTSISNAVIDNTTYYYYLQTGEVADDIRSARILFSPTLSNPSVDLYTGEDGGSMTKKATYTTDQDEIDLTSEVEAIGVGKWINLQFRPTKRMRIEADASIKIFIESR